MEVVWLLVASIALGIAIRNSFSSGIVQNYKMFGISAFAFVIFFIRRYYRINNQKK